MRPRFDEGRAEIRITDFPFERLTQRVTVQRDAEAFLVEALRNGPDRHFWKLIDFCLSFTTAIWLQDQMRH